MTNYNEEKVVESAFNNCAFYKDGSCTALNDLYCKNGNCKFFKTNDILCDEYVKTTRRLKKLRMAVVKR